MLRRATAVVIGLMVGVFLIALIQASSVVLYPPPPGADLSDKDVLRDYIQSRPMGALILVLVAYAAGSFAGAATAAAVGRDEPRRVAITVGSLLLIAGILNLLQQPHPIWFAVASMLVYLPSAWLGGRLGEWLTRARTKAETADVDE